MHAIIKDLNKIYKDFNIVSKYTIKYGTVVILTLFAMAFYFFIQSLTAENAIQNTILYNDILFSIKECMGSVYILPMLFETFSMIIRNR